jgi:hypothetical protein
MIFLVCPFFIFFKKDMQRYTPQDVMHLMKPVSYRRKLTVEYLKYCKVLLSPACLSCHKIISNSRSQNKRSHSNIFSQIFSVLLAVRAS